MTQRLMWRIADVKASEMYGLYHVERRMNDDCICDAVETGAATKTHR